MTTLPIQAEVPSTANLWGSPSSKSRAQSTSRRYNPAGTFWSAIAVRSGLGYVYPARRPRLIIQIAQPRRLQPRAMRRPSGDQAACVGSPEPSRRSPEPSLRIRNTADRILRRSRASALTEELLPNVHPRSHAEFREYALGMVPNRVATDPEFISDFSIRCTLRQELCDASLARREAKGNGALSHISTRQLHRKDEPCSRGVRGRLTMQHPILQTVLVEQ